MANSWGTSWSPAGRDTWGGSWGGGVVPPPAVLDYSLDLARKIGVGRHAPTAPPRRRRGPKPVRARGGIAIGVCRLDGQGLVGLPPDPFAFARAVDEALFWYDDLALAEEEVRFHARN